ncbi:hypothetical protein GCK72_005884 [Caenorhabditis remanei]|uniref:Uncharacterized protein n=1 Tax=Caenorhabditis remanei TaxID=31234 RepID=E3M474_CAERE|nr:hypothetical protein GCK72_005884 [Caenorhabditis remanei]EFO91555.1 hypothetical protein CRE_11704 [Caenorhabditis remanei]KAF1765931.1 hypothetical protein GCK72_005884 [Caenorhabditis remanei]
MTECSDDDIFADFDDRMDTAPIQLGDSDDSFDEGFQKNPSAIDEKSVIEEYRKLKEESKRIDEVAVQIKSLIMICREMEECYTKRIDQSLTSFGEIRYLHDGSILLLVTIHNITSQPMIDWTLSVHPSSVFPRSFQSASFCQSIPLGTLVPGVRKSFQCHLNCEEPPFLLNLSLIREFQLDDIRKVFKIELDPISVTFWNQAQLIQRKSSELNTSFSSSIRLPNSLVNLLSGSPDIIVSIAQVFKAIFKVSNIQNDTIILCIPSNATDNFFVKVTCAKDGTAHHLVTIGTESSRSHTLLTQHLRLHLIVEMSKLKSRPAKGILMLTKMDAVSVEELFKSMLGAFH